MHMCVCVHIKIWQVETVGSGRHINVHTYIHRYEHVHTFAAHTRMQMYMCMYLSAEGNRNWKTQWPTNATQLSAMNLKVKQKRQYANINGQA